MDKRNKAARTIIAVLVTAILVLSVSLVLHPPKIPVARADNTFAGQPTVSFPFTVNETPSGGTQYVALPNRGQIGEMISYSWASACTTAANSATFILEGSNDNTNWFALATSQELDATPGFGIAYSNGYWNFKRLAFPGCTNADTFTGVYVGYGIPLPITQTSETPIYLPIAANAGIGPVGYFLVQGFQCYNAALTRAYLIFGGLTWSLGPGTEFQYQGSSFLEQGQVTQFGAFTDATGATPVSTPVECTFQLTGGPLYPVSPKL